MVAEDLITKQVEDPPGRWCSSGHIAPETFRREGPGSEWLPTRFFKVFGKAAGVAAGTYCEPCLVIANHIAEQKRLGVIDGI